jgi:hypothetical protein
VDGIEEGEMVRCIAYLPDFASLPVPKELHERLDDEDFLSGEIFSAVS